MRCLNIWIFERPFMKGSAWRGVWCLDGLGAYMYENVDA